MAKKQTVTIPSMKALLEAGVHFGHQSRRWNPAMAPYIFAKKKGIHIFDLAVTRAKLEEAAEALQEVSATGKPIIFVCTKRQAKEMVRVGAESIGAMHVTNRWLGGTLTNFETVQRSLKEYKRLAEGLEAGTFENFTKKERGLMQRRKDRLDRLYGGIRELTEMPAALVVIDPRREKTAVKEANLKGVPVFALVDSNCTPTGIDYVVPGNDDAFRSVRIILDVFLASIAAGRGEKAPAPLADRVVPTVKKTEEAVETKKATSEVVEEKKAVEVSSKTDAPKEDDAGLDILDLSVRAVNALTKAGVTTLVSLKKMTAEELDEVKGLGKKTVEEILEKIK